MITLVEVDQAHDTVRDAPESALVICGLGCVVDDTLSGLMETILFTSVGAIGVDEAGAEDDEECAGDHHEESLWQNEANNYGENSQAETRVGIVAVRCEAHVGFEHINSPGSIKKSSNCFEYEASLLHVIIFVSREYELEEQSHDSFRDDADIEEGHDEISRLKLTAQVHLGQREETRQTSRSEAAQLEKFVLVLLLEALDWSHPGRRCHVLLVLVGLAGHVAGGYIVIIRLVLVIVVLTIVISIKAIDPALMDRCWLFRRRQLTTFSEGL